MMQDLEEFLLQNLGSDQIEIVTQKKKDESSSILDVSLGGSGERLYRYEPPGKAEEELSSDDKDSILEELQEAIAEQDWISTRSKRIRPKQ